jgi:TP901 family phage tail tape measure protein
MAFMENMNSVLLKLAGGSMEAGAAIAAIGGVGAEAQASLQSLVASGASAQQIMQSMGSTSEQINAEVMRLIVGNSNVEQSLASLGLAFQKERIEEGLFVQSRRQVESMTQALSAKLGASGMRGAVLDPSGQRATKARSADVYMSKNPMDYESAGEIALARKIQKITEAAKEAGIAVKLPMIEMGEDKARINMARLAMTWENLGKEIRKVAKDERELEQDERGHFALMKKNLDAAIKQREALHRAEIRQQQEMAKIRANEVRREMDQMYVSMSSATAKQYITKPAGSDIFGGLFGKGGKLESKFVTGLFQNIERGSQLASKGVMSLVRSLTSAGSSMAFMTASIGGLFAIITGASIGATFKMASDFEHAMARIMILVKKGESDLPTLTNQVKEFSKAFGMSPMASAEGFRIAISSDVPPGEVAKFMEEAGKLAVTQSATIEKTADMMSMMRNAFNLTTKDMSRLRDMIFVMTDRGRVEVEQFSGEIGKISSVAATAGVNMQEMLAGFAALSRTKGPEQAGTMLINLFKLISKQGPEAKKILRDLNITLSPEQTKAEGLIKQIEKIHDALEKNPAIVEQITDDFRELRAWGEITGSQFDALKSIMEDMYNSVGVGDQHFNEMMDTTEVRWNRLMAQMRQSAMEMGIAVMKSFNEWVDSSGGVEAAQMKISQGFKQIELAVRYFLGAMEFVGTGVMAVLGAIAGAVYTVYKGFEVGGKMIAGMFQGLREKSLLGDIERVNDAIFRLKTQLGSRDEPILKEKIDQLTKQRDEIQQQLTEVHDQQRQRVSDIDKTFEEWGHGMENVFKPAAALGKALAENADKIHDLQQEIADLDVVMKNSAEDHAAMVKYQASLTAVTKKATEAIREQAKATQELVVNLLKDQVDSGKTLLKEWVHDNSEAVKQVIAGYRKLATEQETLTKKLKGEMKDLIKDREKYDDSVQNSIDKIKEQDQKPDEIVKNRIAKGQILEERANVAAKIGDRDEVQRLVQEASGIYESILGVDSANTKKNRETVIEAMQRLKDQMDKVYEAEQEATKKRIDSSEKAAKAFTDKANLIEQKFKEFEQGVTDLTRDITKLSKAPTEEALKTLKDRIMKLMGDAQFFVTIDNDPALSALDRTIEKVKELKTELATVPDFLNSALGNDESTRKMLYEGTGKTPPWTSWWDGLQGTSNVNNTTNVDMRGTTINAGSEGGGPKKADARKLARDLKRHIERGEAPALTRRK